MKKLNDFLSDMRAELVFGTTLQTLCFYVLVLLLLFITYQSIKYNHDRKAAYNIKLDKCYFLVDECVRQKNNLLRENEELRNETDAMKMELFQIGKDFELLMEEADHLSTLLLQSLDQTHWPEIFLEADEWSADISTDIISLSRRSKQLFGTGLQDTITLHDIFRTIDPKYSNEIVPAILGLKKGAEPFVKDFLIHPLDGSTAKRLKISGRADYNTQHEVAKIGGYMRLCRF